MFFIQTSHIFTKNEFILENNWLLGVLEEGKPVYFPRGSYIDVALKTSPKQIHKKLNAMIEKMNAYIEYPGKSLSICLSFQLFFKDISKQFFL